MSDIKKTFDYIIGHPMLLAVIIFGLLFLFYNVFKKSASSSGATKLPPGSYIDPVTGAITSLPTVQDTYAQQYNQYPVYTGTTIQQGGGTPGPAGPTGPKGPTGPTGKTENGDHKTVPPFHNTRQLIPPTPKPAPKPVSARYITVKPWPDQLSTLSGIASFAHVSLSQIEALNPQYKSNYNLIYAGQRVRVS